MPSLAMILLVRELEILTLFYLLFFIRFANYWQGHRQLLRARNSPPPP